MKKFSLLPALFTVSLLSGCHIIGGIFKAGAYAGIIVAVVVIAIIIWLFSKFSNRG